MKGDRIGANVKMNVVEIRMNGENMGTRLTSQIPLQRLYLYILHPNRESGEDSSKPRLRL